MERKKVLIVDNSIYVTGCINSILRTSVLLKNDYEFIYVLPKESSVFALVRSFGFEAIPLPMQEMNKSWKLLIYLPVLFVNTFRLLKIIRDYKITILHINDVYNMLGITVKLCRSNINLIYYVRLLRTSYLGIAYPFFSFWVRLFANHIICVSQAVMKDIGTPANGIVIYANRVTEKYPPWAGLREPGRARILYVGNYIEGKGHKLAISALKKVNVLFPDVTLRCIGGIGSDGNEGTKNALMQMASELKLSSHIEFGELTSDVEGEMKAADIVLNLSESESFSMVCLEAISFGVPLISSDCGGPAEITDNGRLGVLVPNRNADAAAFAIVEILLHPNKAIERAMEGKKFAEKTFDDQRAVEGLTRSYA